MCMFSAPVRDVSGTSIFVRVDAAGIQHTAYQMKVMAESSVAMILPVPAKDPSTFEFIDLSDYAALFDDLAQSMTEPTRSLRELLAVERVGNYEASYAPSSTELRRLDPRFQLPEDVWDLVGPRYAGWGFAVFQLAGGDHEFHPMAFRFETRARTGAAFFPTLHVHDGAVHETAHYDHSLYGQGTPFEEGGRGWSSSDPWAVNTRRTCGVVDGGKLYMRRMTGRQKNGDVVVRSTG